MSSIIDSIREKLGAGPVRDMPREGKYCRVCDKKLERRDKKGIVTPVVEFICIGCNDFRCRRCFPGSAKWLQAFRKEPKYQEYYKLFVKYGG